MLSYIISIASITKLPSNNMDLFESKLDTMLKAKIVETNEFLEVKATAKATRAAEKAAAIESGIVIEKPKPKRTRKKKDSSE